VDQPMKTYLFIDGLRRPRIGGHRREIGLRRLCRGVNGFVLVG